MFKLKIAWESITNMWKIGSPGTGSKLTLTLANEQILDASKLKKCADDNFKFDENGRTFWKWVENMVGKGEIAHYEQFLLSLTVFSKDLHRRQVKTRAKVWKRVKSLGYSD